MTYFNEKFGQSQSRGEILSLQFGPSVLHTYGDKLWHLHQATIEQNVGRPDDRGSFMESCLPNLRQFFTERSKPRLLALCDRKFLRKGLIAYSEIGSSDTTDISRNANSVMESFPLRYCPQECFQSMPTWPDSSGEPMCPDHCPPVYERLRQMLEDCDRVAQVRLYCLAHCPNDYWSRLILELLPEVCDSFDLVRKVHISPVDGIKLSTASYRERHTYYYLKLAHDCLCTIGGSLLFHEEQVDDRDEHTLCSAHVDPMEYFTRELNSPGLFQMTKSMPGSHARVFSISRGGPTLDTHYPVAMFREGVPDFGTSVVHTFIALESGRALRRLTSQSVLRQMPHSWRAAVRHNDQEESNALIELSELHELLDWYEQMPPASSS